MMMMKRKAGYIFVLGVALFAMQACDQQQKSKAPKETLSSGTATIAVDESFEPIVGEEAYVFTQLNPGAKPNIVYKTENAVLKQLLNDSVRIAILARTLTDEETKLLKSRTLPPIISRFAVDAIALIVNKASADTLITVAELKKMLNGETKTDVNIVFDNPNSSLIRYLKEFSGNKEFKQKNIYALKTNKDVIAYVSEHPKSIGITGFSWLNDPDKDYADAVSKVKIVAVKDEQSKDANYFKPSQTTLVLKQYPLIRGLYVINSTGKMGLGTGFAYFMISERGQRIILRSGLLPDSIPGREINIKHTY